MGFGETIECPYLAFDLFWCVFAIFLQRIPKLSHVWNELFFMYFLTFEIPLWPEEMVVAPWRWLQQPWEKVDAQKGDAAAFCHQDRSLQSMYYAQPPLSSSLQISISRHQCGNCWGVFDQNQNSQKEEENQELQQRKWMIHCQQKKVWRNQAVLAFDRHEKKDHPIKKSTIKCWKKYSQKREKSHAENLWKKSRCVFLKEGGRKKKEIKSFFWISFLWSMAYF